MTDSSRGGSGNRADDGAQVYSGLRARGAPRLLFAAVLALCGCGSDYEPGACGTGPTSRVATIISRQGRGVRVELEDGARVSFWHLPLVAVGDCINEDGGLAGDDAWPVPARCCQAGAP